MMGELSESNFVMRNINLDFFYAQHALLLRRHDDARKCFERVVNQGKAFEVKETILDHVSCGTQWMNKTKVSDTQGGSLETQVSQNVKSSKKLLKKINRGEKLYGFHLDALRVMNNLAIFRHSRTAKLTETQAELGSEDALLVPSVPRLMMRQLSKRPWPHLKLGKDVHHLEHFFVYE